MNGRIAKLCGALLATMECRDAARLNRLRRSNRSRGFLLPISENDLDSGTSASELEEIQVAEL